MTTEKKIAAARKEVNAETFGTPAWEQKMQIVRDLVQAQTDALPPFEHTSVDGDIWSV